jgi:Transposase DDE domain group 1
LFRVLSPRTEAFDVRDSTTTPCLLFPDLFDRPLTATFDVPNASSDGGAVLLKAADRRLGLIPRLAAALVDERQGGKVRHALADLLGQRIYGLALGYDDASDAARLADDPVHKLLIGRDPVAGVALASQPTLSRFENEVTRGELLALGEALFETVLDRHRRRRRKVRRITIDLDVTDDPTHGAQQLSCFNGFYDHACYLPLLAFLTFDHEREQHLCAAALRPGNASTQAGALTFLKRIVGRLQDRFPKARILVRLDGGFAAPELFEFLDIVGVDYVVAMAKNKVLEREAEFDLIVARVLSEASGLTEHVYTDFRYAAGTWDRERRVVCKAEVVRLEGREPRLNARFVVTNLAGKARRVYERIYCMRGEIENRIKELFDVALDRTSCPRFRANQLRVLLAAAAYVLLQELRLAARGTAWARAQVATLRLELLKIGVQVITSARRLVLRLPAAFPYRDGWRRIALNSGATSG